MMPQKKNGLVEMTTMGKCIRQECGNLQYPGDLCMIIGLLEQITNKMFSAFPSVLEPPRGKTNNVVSEHVQHKPTCTNTEKS